MQRAEPQTETRFLKETGFLGFLNSRLYKPAGFKIIPRLLVRFQTGKQSFPILRAAPIGTLSHLKGDIARFGF